MIMFWKQPCRAGTFAVAFCGATLVLGGLAYAQTTDVTCHIEYTPMRDGVRLATEVYLPGTAGKYPVVMQRTPYNRNGAAVDNNCNNTTLQFFAKNGYAALNQDVRGMFRSEGTFNAMVQEARDGYDAIEWAAVQSWSTGRIGMFSGSYVGLTQWQPAIHTPPHLTAISPNVTASDYHDHWTYVNSVFDLWFAQSWLLLTFGPETYLRDLLATGLSREQANQEVANWVAKGRADILSKWVWQLPLESFPVYRSIAPYYYDWLEHPSYDRFWARLDIEPRYHNVTVPALNSGGWYDIFQIGTVRNFQGMRTEGGSAVARSGSKLVMWSTCHACPPGTFAGAIDFGPNNQVDMNALNLRWFDHWLKGIDNGIDREPAVKLFVMVPPDTGTTGGGFWVTGDEYPLPNTQGLRFYLHSRGNANTRLGDGALDVRFRGHGRPDEYVYDPREPVPTRGGNMCCINDLLPSGAFDQSTIEARDDVLVYTSAPLTQDLVVIGPIKVNLWAASSARDTDFTAKLVDVHLDGFAHNVLDRIVRAQYRKGSKLPPSFTRPDKPYEYLIEMGNTATVFKKGHKVRLEISSSNFPHYARNQNTVNQFGEDARLKRAFQTIFHDAAHPSSLELPVAYGVTVP
jgi:putative CocE/NonD family hydrolase